MPVYYVYEYADRDLKHVADVDAETPDGAFSLVDVEKFKGPRYKLIDSRTGSSVDFELGPYGEKQRAFDPPPEPTPVSEPADTSHLAENPDTVENTRKQKRKS